VTKRQSQYKTYEKYLFGKIRQIFTWTHKSKAMFAGKVGVNQYVCIKCKKIFKSTEIDIDHITPVMPLTGWDGKWTEYINRTFEGETQLLCKVHHKEKTKKEAGLRAKCRKDKNV